MKNNRNLRNPIALIQSSRSFNINNGVFFFKSQFSTIYFASLIFFFLGCSFSSCDSNIKNKFNTNNFEKENKWEPKKNIIPAAERVAVYYPKLKGKRVGLVVNHSSRIGEAHLVDSLLSLEVDIASIFTPEHGLEGTADAGQKISNSTYGEDNIPIISLYGSARKPTLDQLSQLDVMVFDIQDVGVRYYTYISTLHYIMEACAEANLPLIILDRPNPNGFYVDGPVLDMAFSSFVGMHPVPVVHGCTIGEYAQMINGEKWLQEGAQCPLEIIPCLNYDHNMTYDLPIKPSPNLPNLRSILLYPSLCLFEGTNLSIGRGTEKQFQLLGHPDIGPAEFSFTPISRPGAKEPKHKDKLCYGLDLTQISVDELFANKELGFDLVIEYYQLFKERGLEFFPAKSSFNRLAGSDQLRQQIVDGLSMEEIRESWQEKLQDFKTKREKYLLYPQ